MSPIKKKREKLREKKENFVSKLNSEYILRESKRKKKAKKILKKRYKQKKKEQQKLQLQKVKERQKQRQKEEYKIMRKQLDSKLKNMKPSGNKIKRLKTNDSDVVDENKQIGRASCRERVSSPG